ncbi:magnesium transporter [Usitatibacter palustris]|uniref:Magnesium transporter MgtE n=1 Tax=Usitatibacter palustris TaxID=2732487 RepID=A0A6M4HCR3_9PROT|nr:magnesium transporter [Usitatibacter palustris]QJR16865.1 Magnesium transporter MgtE [Usitatibacter palustris]
MARPREELARSPSPQEHLDAVAKLLAKRRLVEDLVHRQGERDNRRPELVEDLVHRQQVAAIGKRLEGLHPGDVAYILEGLPLDDRLVAWGLVSEERRGDVLLEAADSVRETLIADMDSAQIVGAAEYLDADEIADLAPDLPDEVVQDILEAQDDEDRAQLQSALSYPEGTVGALMDFEVVSIRDDVTCEVALRYLRRYEELPSQTDALFVVDRVDHLKGALPLKRLLVSDPEVEISTLYDRDILSFSPESEADDAAHAFERYDLVSAPVVDVRGKIVGRVTVESVLEFVRERQEAQALGKVGLREEEDLFSSVWASAKNRGPWLALNLCTAFVASRVVGAFEGSIEKLAALAALMPIVAGIGGNSGNQTTTLIVRSLALGQVSPSNARRLLLKELAVATANGVIWGGVLGIVAWLLYRNVALGGVMALAMLLNLLVAALAGIFIPLAMERFGRDPAVGSSVFLTFVTDSMGFFIFLGLATVFLL